MGVEFKNMNKKTIILTVAMSMGLSACSLGRGAPDEFEVVSNASLVVPPEMELAPPRAGKAQNRNIAPSLIAKEILFPKKDVKDKEPPKGAEADLLKKLKLVADADVRSNVGTPDVKVSKKRLLIAEILEMQDGSDEADNVSVKRTSGN